MLPKGCSSLITTQPIQMLSATSTQTLMPLETFFGPAMCLDVSQVAENSLIGPDVIQEAEKIAALEIQTNDIVLFYTGHYDHYYPNPEYLEGYSGFSLESAVYLINEKKIKN